MPTLQFNIGDRVRIRETAEGGGPYSKYRGTEVTIKNWAPNTDPAPHHVQYFMEESYANREGDLYWYEDELELVMDDQVLIPAPDLTSLFGGAGK